ncbi:protein FAM122A [Biomphalaria glabrata]|uniref:P2R1A-PPP2R2A-interacting phosphatase regulator 1-like n=1 Tax=Biomphalaria glabrata TaxID=6526 RepID=A0A9U8E0M0_BIOGL|nr:P2R1A-PPP2R2A-interacting phosphatase regulator 1-like [Biomphalaria glabrata]XP_013067580.2 P2R1A-PPP2R2A-interacting phosphatase regulator 1-like [Biomphalaria glabrata]KAI8751337.1 FAM122A-like protein [Biomphalaria glabrata]KAI8770426.1 protein FAM122A [Biomphalaria glabrata]
MEVDPPASSSSSPQQNSGGTLKRSNSAPMINTLVTSEAEVSPPTSFKTATSVALRRLSSSNMSLHNAPSSTSPPIRSTDRVTRIKQEEIHKADIERQHEREIQSSIWISQNWDSLSFDTSEPMESQRRQRSFSESLHIMTQPNILCGSPSPTRAAAKQCFSPSMQIPVKNTTFTPSPSPSPTRKSFHRSLSPIAMRNAVSLKRKLENDGDKWDYISPPKKFSTGASTPDRIMTCVHPLANSISSSSLDANNHQQSLTRSNSLGTSMSHLHRSPLNNLAAGLSPISVGGSQSSPSTIHSQVGSSSSALMSVSKQGFMFQPVSDAMGSPSSTSSSSSSNLSMPLHHLHPHPEQQNSQGSDRSPLPHQGHTVGMSLQQQPLRTHSAMSNDGNSHNSNDIYMSDTEMRDHSDMGCKSNEGFTHSELDSKTSEGFNFKPIRPDYT